MPVDSNVFDSTAEERGILEFASLIEADLIAMGTHARRGISHLVNGNLDEDVVNRYEGRVWTYSRKTNPGEL